MHHQCIWEHKCTGGDSSAHESGARNSSRLQLKLAVSPLEWPPPGPNSTLPDRLPGGLQKSWVTAFCNVSIEGDAQLASEWLKFRDYWGSQIKYPWQPLGRAEQVSGRAFPATEGYGNREAHSAAIRDAQIRYTDAPILEMETSSLQEVCDEFTAVEQAWLKGDGSPLTLCPYCKTPLYIKHYPVPFLPKFHSARDDRLHNFCEKARVWADDTTAPTTEPGAGEAEEGADEAMLRAENEDLSSGRTLRRHAYVQEREGDDA